MRVLFAILAIAVVSTCALVAPEDDFAESYEDVPAMNLVEDDTAILIQKTKKVIKKMKKKGATEADCKDLAKTTCTEVESEVKTDQSGLNKLADGSKCLSLGQGAIRKAVTELRRTLKAHEQAKIKVSVAAKAKVNFGLHKYSTLKPGNCGFIFGSRAYLTAKATYTSAIKVEVMWRGRVKEARRSLVLAKAAAKRAVHKCLCATKKARDDQWKIVSSKTRRARQVKAHAKCKMMSCVLNGTKLTSSKCKSTLQKLKKKTLIRQAEAAKCSGKTTPKKKPTPKKPVAPKDPCKKWKAEKAANAEIAKDLRSRVDFASMKTILRKKGQLTLNKVVKTLKKYPWMSINLQGHSSAPKGSTCTRLVNGRANSSRKYLLSKGVKNAMKVVAGTCGKIKAMTISNASGQKAAPRGCRE